MIINVHNNWKKRNNANLYILTKIYQTLLSIKIVKRTKLTNKWYWTKFQYQHTFSFSSWPKNNSDHSVAIAACSVSNAFLMMVAMCILLLSSRRCFPFWKNLIESDSVMQKRRGSEKEARGNQAWSWKKLKSWKNV